MSFADYFDMFGGQNDVSNVWNVWMWRSMRKPEGSDTIRGVDYFIYDIWFTLDNH